MTKHYPPRFRRAPIVLAIAAASALLAVSCSAGGSNPTAAGNTSPLDPGALDSGGNKNAPKEGASPREGGTLRFAVDAETDGFNPVANNLALAGNMIASTIYDPLVRIDEQRKAVPYLAESVTRNDDGTVWTIKARPGVTFHDGTPFNGEAIRVNIDQRTKSALSAIALEPVSSVETTDAMTVQVKMKRPWTAYDYTLAAQGGYMVSPKALLAADGTINPEAANHPVGTGPFEFDNHTRDSSLTVKKNRNYWQKGKPYLDGIDFRIVTDAGSRSQSLQAGTVDAVMTEQSKDVKKFRTESGYVQAEDLAAEEAFIMLNSAVPPFDNINARRALAYATDRQGVIEGVADGLPPEADQPYVPSEQWHVPDAGYPAYDAQRAKDAVEQYKKDTGQSSLTFELTNRPGGSESALAQLLQQQWQEAGIEMKIKTVEQTQVILNAVYGRYQALSFRNFAYVDPDSNYIFWHSSSAKGLDQLSINFTQTKDPEIDAALDKARGSTDSKVRKDAYATVVKRLNQDLPYIWLYHNLWAITANSKVQGLNHAQQLGFARVDAKPWWADLWLQP